METILTLIQEVPKRKGKRFGLYRCKCGTIKEVNMYMVSSNKTLSCGCLKYKPITHGKSYTPEYPIWKEIIQRCTNPNHPQYNDYGGRGIKICDEWKDSFETFINDLGKRPEKHTIERRDNNLDYNKSNCYWATRVEQNNNRRNNHLITINGKTQTLFQWCKEYNLNPSTVCTRLRKGLSEQDAILLPLKRKKKYVKEN